ncbi:MAG TPA: glycosyltransferase family 4 protein [Gaiellales bacterium]|nr:glycosyltransferase family 4 protein [Gaiellales bacterium]
MRILIVCDFLLKYASQQARALSGLGNDVRLLCRSHALEFGGSEAERDELLDGLREHGVDSVSVPGRIRSLSAVPDMVEIRRSLRRWRPDVVQAHENHDPRLLALTSGLPSVLTVHDPLGHPGAPALTRSEDWTFRRWFHRADWFIVHGRALADELADLYPGRPIAIVPHGISPLPQPLPPPPAPSVLLFGRLEQYKGVEVLVDAMRLVWRQRPEVRLVVAGTGHAARLVPQDERISLLQQYIPEAGVDGLFAAASLVVLPYTQASQSGVGAQALARGIPVVVSDAGALPDLAIDQSYVAAAGSDQSLADAILAHVDDGPETRRAVLRHARDHLSWQHAAELTADVYRDVLAARGRR